ncbi:BRCA1-A complex subunit RAP80 isoform X2 [Brienomyrus brachyistius]|uniref:BRCA1-A complex subunit RAP80 isoform X2 n=1 Tax=Brienomyrus brachyistius TaxID=42636 RepID=UPI0020B421E1|nr:BRCA1-A complex subunit RAP80 isoform X2 [Brienomyrus brachyistius]
MPRKKRCRPRDSGDDAGSVSRKRRHTESQGEIVPIPDSEHEEEEFKPSARESRLRGRESKAQTKELTDDEMLTLALKRSAEEATTAELRHKEEEEAVKKAIEESLHANETQIISNNSESPLLSGQDSPPVPASPVFPARDKPSLQNSSKIGPDGSDCYDAVIDMDEENQHPQRQTLDVCQWRSDGSSKPLPALEKGKYSEAESSSQEIQGPSRCQWQRGKGSGDIGNGSPRHGPVLCIERLSQELVDDCQASGFVLCSQELPVHLTPSGRSASSPPASPTLSESPVFARMDLGSMEKGVAGKGTYSPAKQAIVTDATQSGDPGNSQDFPESQGLDADSSDSSQSLLCPRRTWALSRKHVPKKRATGGRGCRGQASQGNVSQSQSEEEPCKTEGGTVCSAERLFLTTSSGTDDPTNQTGRAWSEEEEDKGPRKRNHMPGDADILSLGRARDADQAASPVFPREVPYHKMCVSGPTSSLGTPRCLMGSPWRKETQEGSKIRRRFTFGNGNVTKSPSRTEDSVVHVPTEEQGGPKEPPVVRAVHYYWGVPFCPRGQNPDDYTQVILSQLEVYEKSLKEARRTLLRKAEWGDPLLPASPERRLRRRGRPKRSRALRLLDEEEEEEEEVVAAEQEEEDDTEEATLVEEGEENGSAGSPKGSKATEETQERNKKRLAAQQQKIPVLCTSEEIPERQKSLRRRGHGESRLAKGGVPHSQGREDEETQLCPESQLSEEPLAELKWESSADTEVHSRDSECEVMVLDQEGSAVAQVEEVEDMETEGGSDSQARGEGVQCPICMHCFPPARIEMHAAYCDGTPEDRSPEEPLSQGQLLHLGAARKKRSRNDVAGENQPSSSFNGRSQLREQCYLCQKTFRLKDYKRHVDNCIQQRPKQEGSRNLLVALDQTEQNVDCEAGSSDSRKKSHSSARPRDDDELGYPVDPGFLVSSSPIRSFTPISEATDCLVDFKRQYSHGSGQRGRRKKF